MLRTLALLLAALALGPLACDDGYPDNDDADDATSAATEDDDAGDDDDTGDADSGEAIEPTPGVPFAPPLGKPCKSDGTREARIGNCDK